ncbi:FAD-dependent tricarballylate dehydrogenase TcuA [Pseudomonas juntendi]|uniref:FAD-dependent tricarballylate dehydrogenase TcuA n=1 Tax=Pseudomonas juntendi TaxID=2666183 RepID=A0ABD4YAI9_9PSED|nr:MULTISPECIES: FAD-dependent tricarballylate dehydrogenase TcuA [Pseudomonas]MDH0756379.1 FAD-dependent tricarballylate dehydrogenase TcuA [Pseudomonas juntendi]MDH1917758.1 FAD-dependent tricarballylate dehydrogenase TcuA [Pseudomonas juntendi]MDH2014724.1 FAD-dependent tricarballylate dehydrogenase TcuA [Pseudomonas juntendi]QDR69431.1 FAD-dependent tricarballylate dehydrogenase TcuA [Pseudomonas sp. BJP69]RRV70614.1 FAD-dependent tricarballylate dehydrogenase TcuA [Pseudomonas sp. p99-361
MIDVLVIGGGNAALCAALMAREAGASVLLLEAAPRAWRGGNSQHTRNLRCMHDAPQDVLVEAYPEEEFWQDLLKVTGGQTNEKLARLVIRASASCRGWMRRHGVHFQPSLSGALHTARTNAFFMGGGKALVNAYFRSAEALGVQIRYDTPVADIELDNGRFVAAHVPARQVQGRTLPGERIEARSCVLAAGGFESNRQWLRDAWGQNERGEWPADNFLIRGTRFNEGVLLRRMIEQGADTIGDPTQAHMVAIDARAPLYDGGICTRIDCVSLGVVVNRDGQRFYDEGEDFWPKRYAIWGRLVAQQPGQVGFSIIDQKALGRFMPPVFPGARADTLEGLAALLGLPVPAFVETVQAYNRACRVGSFDHTRLDDCHTQGLQPVKSHWARPLDTPPYYGYPLRPGVTFTYLGLRTDETAAVHFAGRPSPNLFVAGEMMAGNVLGKGYTAGVGMSIGTAFGRIAGTSAAAATGHDHPEHENDHDRATA